jgi:hypothetical protein
MNLTVEVCPMETASIAVTGEFYPKFSKAACSKGQMLGLLETRGYSAIASCVIEHVVTNSELKESERLYYVLADLYANYNRAKDGQRSCTMPGSIWEQRLNLSEEYVFVLQKSLEAKGYFDIKRGLCDNQNEINVITPTLPAAVIEKLQLGANRNNPRTDSTNDNSVRSLLDDTKLFVKFNNKQIEMLIQNDAISPLQKLIWIFLYLRSNCSYQGSGDWRSTITQTEISQIFKCSQSAASKALTQLEEAGFIAKSQQKTLVENSASNRRKKSVWFVEAVFPSNSMNALLQQRARANISTDYEYATQSSQAVDKVVFIPTVEGEYSLRSGGYSLRSGQYSQSSVSSIKDITTKSILIKNNKQQTSKSPDVIDVIFETNKKIQESMHAQDSIANGPLNIDIVAEKNRRNIEKLAPSLVKKAVNFAKKLKRDKLCAPSLIDVDELELARQFIHHAANYKMTKLGCKTRDEEVEAALSFAWRAAKNGQWRCPVGWGQAIDLHLEREKYMYEHHDAPVVRKFEGKVTRYLDS